MASNRIVRAARAGTIALRAWQSTHGELLDLSGADLTGCDLRWMNFAGASLEGVNFQNGLLTGAYFGPAQFQSEAPHVSKKNIPVNLDGARFDGSVLLAATFNYASLRHASFEDTYLGLANFRNVVFDHNSFAGATLVNTGFAGCNMSGARGLEACVHHGPSHLDIATLRQSKRLTRSFLRQTGIPDTILEALPRLAAGASQFYSCFLSHSSGDQQFCDRLYTRLVQETVTVWYAPEDMKGGDLIVSQVKKAVDVHDKVIVVLSKNSLQSAWVANEIKWAQRREHSSGDRALFPISLVSFDLLRRWERIDPDTGIDLAEEVRKYYVPDFSNWTDNQQFDQGVNRLLRDLRVVTTDTVPRRSARSARRPRKSL
jgi:uncharacterized protein YjbI with pentapeptide repeats